MSAAISGTYLIMDSRIAELGAKLKRLSKVAVKLGLPEFQIHVGDPVFKKIRRADSLTSSNEVVMFREVTFTGQQPILGNWRFHAKLEHTEAGNIIQRARFGGEQDPLPDEYRTCPPRCEHCNTNRDRNNTYLFKHVEDGSIKQVGSSCFKDFDGHGDPAALLSFLDGVVDFQDWADKIVHEDDELGLGGASGERYYELGAVLATAVAVIRREGGYVSSGAVALEPATKDTVAYYLMPGNADALKSLVNANDTEKAEQILEWMKSLPDDCTEYEHSLKTIAKLGAVSRKHLGYAVSAAPAWERHQRDLGKGEVVSVHLGTKGDKWTDRQVVFNRSPSFDTQWGTTYNVIMTDVETGGQLVWKTGSPLPFLTDHEYRVNCTIKGHSEYQDVKQTEVTRVTCPSLKLVEDTRIVREENIASILKLIRKTTDVNVVDSHNRTALQNIVEYANACIYHEKDNDTWKPLVQAMLDAGADPLLDNRGRHPVRTPLDSALVYVETNEALTRMLLDHMVARGHDMSSLQTVLTNSDFSFGVYSDDPEDAAANAQRILKEYGAPYAPALGPDDKLELREPQDRPKADADSSGANGHLFESELGEVEIKVAQVAPGQTGDLFGFAMDEHIAEEEEVKPRQMRMG